jgi:hypothetical protein
MILKTAIAFALALTGASIAIGASAAGEPDCAGPDRWPARMALVKLLNTGAVARENVAFNRIESVPLASRRIGKDRWRQIFRVTVPLKSRPAVVAIVVSDASRDECSLGDPQVFLVSRTL